MNLRTLGLVALLGLATPMVMAGDALIPQAAIAQSTLEGDFMNDRWFVSVWYEGGSYRYQGVDRRSGNSLRLAGATESGDRTRRIYTWNNSGHRYQVTWRPSDPDFVRLQVFHPDGRELVNNLLSRVPFSP
jgi:hypothetical protein